MAVGDLADAGHDAHIQDNHDGVGDLDPDLCQRGTRRAHEIRNHIQRAALHAAGQQAIELRMHLRRSRPVVGRADFLAGRSADEGQLLDAGNVVGIGPAIIAARKLFLVELHEHAVRDGFPVQKRFFGFRSVDPKDLVGFRQFGDLGGEVENGLVIWLVATLVFHDLMCVFDVEVCRPEAGRTKHLLASFAHLLLKRGAFGNVFSRLA